MQRFVWGIVALVALGTLGACRREAAEKSASARAARRYPCQLLEVKRRQSPAEWRMDSALAKRRGTDPGADTLALRAACDSVQAARPQ